MKIGDSVMTRFDEWKPRLEVVKSKKIKKSKTIRKGGITVKMYPLKGKRRSRGCIFCDAANHLCRNMVYKIEGFTKNGGVMLEGFLIPVSRKHLKIVEP